MQSNQWISTFAGITNFILFLDAANNIIIWLALKLAILQRMEYTLQSVGVPTFKRIYPILLGNE